MDATNEANKGLKQFVILWSGQFMALLGSGLASFGFSVWIYENTGSTTPFAFSFLATILPGILFGPVAGSFADRKKRKLTIMMANVLDIITKVILGILFYYKSLDLWMIYFLLFCSSTFQTFQVPALSASIPALVPSKSLSRANGMMQLSQMTQVMLSPMVAGFLYPHFGLLGLLGTNFFTFIFAIVIFSLLKIPQTVLEKTNDSALRIIISDFKVSLKYLQTKKGLLGLIIIMGLANFVSVTTTILMGPLVLGNYNTSIYGTVQFISGIAMLIGGLFAGLLPNTNKKVKAIFLTSMLSAFGIIFAGFPVSWTVIAFGFFLYNIPMPYGTSLLLSILQTKVESKYLGRVTALAGMIFRIIMPIATLLAGPLADKVFEPAMQKGGVLGRSFVGTLLGTGPGKGINLFFITIGLIFFIINWVFLKNTTLMSIENRLPNFELLQEPGVIHD